MTMATLEDAHIQRWRAFVPSLPYNRDFGIPTFWRQHPELGSPIGHELDLGDGTRAQAFAGGVVHWTPSGAEIVSG
jgi:hypothetical protein